MINPGRCRHLEGSILGDNSLQAMEVDVSCNSDLGTFMFDGKA